MTAITLPLQPTADDIAHLERPTGKFPAHQHLLDPNNEIRQRIIMERAVVRKAISDIIAAGNWVRVFYGPEEGYGCDRTDNLDVAMEAIMACDEESVIVFPNSSDKRIGFLFLVYGNEGWSVIADNSTKLEGVLQGATDFADELADATSAACGYGNGGGASRRAEDGYVGA
jgi:hypothetical protein